MSATRCKKPHADILIGIEMTRERNLGIKKKTPGISVSVYLCICVSMYLYPPRVCPSGPPRCQPSGVLYVLTVVTQTLPQMMLQRLGTTVLDLVAYHGRNNQYRLMIEK